MIVGLDRAREDRPLATIKEQRNGLKAANQFHEWPDR
jgi:hypothetical protein